ncbi:pyroglutamyl-peptidase I [uncultured Demequina sp.]|uniref:pyroglutamyl-peptidase I n=1 Tax=uncultured Demequina sp. TaxID=693499 RepID=UPI0025CD9BAA|nr:pyroglutamyl-peptidase I [uncultured Demequina sp.]
MPSVLLTGFEPFADARINPSWDAAEAVAVVGVAGARVTAVRLPVAFGRASAELGDAIDVTRPDVVIALGLAEGRSGLTPERVAVNLDDARIPDNTGASPLDLAVIPGAPAAFFSTLPVKAIVAGLAQAGIPASVSLSAGTYVCNHTFYALQHATHGTSARSGFIHVPATPEMGLDPGVATLTADQIARGVAIAVSTSLARTADAALPGGTIH